MKDKFEDGQDITEEEARRQRGTYRFFYNNIMQDVITNFGEATITDEFRVKIHNYTRLLSQNMVLSLPWVDGANIHLINAATHQGTLAAISYIESTDGQVVFLRKSKREGVVRSAFEVIT